MQPLATFWKYNTSKLHKEKIAYITFFKVWKQIIHASMWGTHVADEESLPGRRRGFYCEGATQSIETGFIMFYFLSQVVGG